MNTKVTVCIPLDLFIKLVFDKKRIEDLELVTREHDIFKSNEIREIIGAQLIPEEEKSSDLDRIFGDILEILSGL